MIRVTVELVPFGFDSIARTLGVLQIANDGTGTIAIGNYDISLETSIEIVRTRLEGIPRKRDGALSLVTEAFRAVQKTSKELVIP